MVNQKELVRVVIDSYDQKEAIVNLIYKWLEDINWHRENTMLTEKLEELYPGYLIKRTELLSSYMYIYYPSLYSKTFIEGLQNDPEFIELKNKAKYNVSEMTMYNFSRSEKEYGLLSRLNGWGIHTQDWEASTGEIFVNELLEMIKAKFEELDKEEVIKRERSAAYAQYD